MDGWGAGMGSGLSAERVGAEPHLRVGGPWAAPRHRPAYRPGHVQVPSTRAHPTGELLDWMSRSLIARRPLEGKQESFVVDEEEDWKRKRMGSLCAETK